MKKTGQHYLNEFFVTCIDCSAHVFQSRWQSLRIWVFSSSWGIPFIETFDFLWEPSGINAKHSTAPDATECGSVVLKFLSYLLPITPSIAVTSVSPSATYTFFQKQNSCESFSVITVGSSIDPRIYAGIQHG